jgi:Fe-S cluster biogenesis protein NfuA
MRGVVVVTAVLAMCCSDVASFSSLSQEHYRSRHTHRIIRQQILAAAGSGSGEPQQIISPFDNSAASSDGDNGSVATTTTSVSSNEILDLTYENVELVLDGMRHFLIQDGGNVIIDEIDGPIVKLQLQGNCGTCPSSTQTMKMGYVHILI